MDKESFSLQIGSVLFKEKSISFIIFGFFLLGLLMGLLSIIHIKNPEASSLVTMPLFWTTVIPIMIIVKGVRKAKVVN